jgi:class 3 adenylate cyclase/predicted ATPase
MQQIADWLGKLGLPEYAERFAQNGIDIGVLPDLTEQDLKDLGVLLGHRRRILRAIAGLESSPTQPLVAAISAPASAPAIAAAISVPPAPATEVAGERRYLTVMFCDLVGSTAISAQLDAEEWRDLVGAYLDAASAAVAEMGGHVAKKLGDGLMCVFGYPLAHENDAERAVRAALAIQRVLADLNRKNAGAAKPGLVARIGLESGPAVLDASGEIYGDVANIAARVQTLADPGTVLATAQVQRQVAGLFVAEDRGAHALKGLPEPTVLFRLVRASGGGRRSGQRNLTPLVGRDDEMAMLMRRWERARQGDGQLVLIVGEPGLGKSRLVEEFHMRLTETPHTWSEWTCSQLLQNTPLHPIAEWGRQRFGGADVPAERRFADLENSLAQVKLDPAENASLLAPLLDIPLTKERVSTLAPEELRRRQLAAVTNWIMASAKTQPLVLAFEDLHWADPTTLDVLRGIAERGASAPLYIVATTRPEFRPPWGMRSHHGTISLAPLDRAQVREMVAELSARHALARDVVDDVAARTGGVPLFVEEVTRLLLERGEQGSAQGIPPTLQQSLMARLDRLGPAREVAQIGSVIGRGFSYKLLKAVAGMDDAPLEAALEKLSDADIVLVEGVLPDSDYRFKHALIQDAAYENLLKSRRQVLHRRIAETLRDRFADKAAAEPEVLAHHFTQAGMTDAAIEWWGKAGDEALRRSAFQEAISHLGKAIEMADKAGGSAPRADSFASSAGRRVKLQTSLGQALMWGKGFGSEESKAAFVQARKLAGGLENPAERASAYYGAWLGSFIRAETAQAQETAEAFLKDATQRPGSPEAGLAHRNYGLTRWFQGDFVGGREHAEQVLTIYDRDRDRELAFKFALDYGISAMAFLALALWPLGEVDRARRIVEDAVAQALHMGHVATLYFVRQVSASIEMIRGDSGRATPHLEAGFNLAREHGMQQPLLVATYGLAWARWRAGTEKADAQAAQMRDGRAQIRKGHYLLFDPLYAKLLADVEMGAGRADSALEVVNEAISEAEQTGQSWFDAELYRARGELLLQCGRPETVDSEAAFKHAVDVAGRQQTRAFELRAALSLAKLYQSTGRAADAHAVLAPALEGFSPTPEFPEIAEAQALLAALADTDEVKNAAAVLQRRLKLQTSYGHALILGKGYAAPETVAAFALARELLAATSDASNPFETYYGQWAGAVMGGDYVLGQETAVAFLREAESASRTLETAAARRMLGLTHLWQGHFTEAQAHLTTALQICEQQTEPGRTLFIGHDTRALAAVYLAQTNWILGEFGRIRELLEGAVARATQLGHVPTLTATYAFEAMFEALRGDAEAARRVSESVMRLSEKHELPTFSALGSMSRGWSRARLGNIEAGKAELRDGLTAYVRQGTKAYAPFFQGLLAEIEAESPGDEAVNRLDEALALAQETGEHGTDAFFHRLRGEILLKRDPVNTEPAEETFLTAIAVAQQQKARSFELGAALSLAKLYQSTGRAADAYAVLAPALEGFSPTPEFPEIEQAKSLFAALHKCS